HGRSGGGEDSEIVEVETHRPDVAIVVLSLRNDPESRIPCAAGSEELLESLAVGRRKLRQIPCDRAHAVQPSPGGILIQAVVGVARGEIALNELSSTCGDADGKGIVLGI